MSHESIYTVMHGRASAIIELLHNLLKPQCDTFLLRPSLRGVQRRGNPAPL
jgi:hypothetical protein